MIIISKVVCFGLFYALYVDSVTPGYSITNNKFWYWNPHLTLTLFNHINMYFCHFLLSVVVDLTDSDSITLGMVWKQIVLNNTFCGHHTKTGETAPGSRGAPGSHDAPVNPETFPVLLLGTKYDIVSIFTKLYIQLIENKYSLNKNPTTITTTIKYFMASWDNRKEGNVLFNDTLNTFDLLLSDLQQGFFYMHHPTG